MRTPSGKSRSLGSGEWPARRMRAGSATVRAVALAQVVASLGWTVLALLLWYMLLPSAMRLTTLALCAALMASGSALSMELARGGRRVPVRVARVLLPAVDFIAALGACWLLAGDSMALVLFLVPVLLATLLLGWRAGALAAGASVVAALAVWLALGGLAGWAWLPGALLLVLAQALLLGGAAAYTRRVSGAQADLLARARQAEQRRDEAASERARLLDGMHLLEQAHVRLEQERATLDRQTNEMAHIVRRLADGDRQGAREQLARVMAASGPIGQALARMAAGLSRLTQQDAIAPELQVRLREQQRQAQSVAHLLGEQAHLLNATDLALRDQAAVANQLVAAIQLLAHSAGGPASQPGTDRYMVLQKMREVEHMALGHASSTAMLGARMAQMRQRHDELDAWVRGLAGAMRPAPASDKLARAESGSRPGESVLGQDSFAGAPSPVAPVAQPWVY